MIKKPSGTRAIKTHAGNPSDWKAGRFCQSRGL